MPNVTAPNASVHASFVEKRGTNTLSANSGLADTAETPAATVIASASNPASSFAFCACPHADAISAPLMSSRVTAKFAYAFLSPFSALRSMTANGSGTWVIDGEKKAWANKDRNALYLDYTVDFGEQQFATRDTLVFRDRGIKMETFSPVYMEK